MPKSTRASSNSITVPEGWAEFSDTEVTWEDAFGKHRYDPKTRTTTVQYHDPAPVRMPLKGKYRA